MPHHPARPLPRDPHAIARSKPRPIPPPFRSPSPPGRPGAGDREGTPRTGPAVRGGQRLHRQARQMPDAARDRRQDRAGRVRPGGREPPNPATCSGRAPCPACCRPASIASPMRRMTCGWRRWPLRSAPIDSAVTARTDARRPAGAARGHRRRRYRADGGGGGAGARPDQYAVERYGPGRTGSRRRRRWRRGSARRSTASSATNS